MAKEIIKSFDSRPPTQRASQSKRNCYTHKSLVLSHKVQPSVVKLLTTVHTALAALLTLLVSSENFIM